MKLSLINKLLIVLLLFILGFFLWTTYSIPFGINGNRVAVIQEMKALKRLETATFTIEKIVDAGTSGNVLQEFLYGDKILLIAHGQIIAGFDFEKVSENDIKIEGKKIIITLPAPIILVTRLDNAQTKVYDRTKGLLAPKNSDLEAKARQAAETSIKTAACEEGILSQASENGKREMMLFFKSLGFTEVEITVRSGSC